MAVTVESPRRAGDTAVPRDRPLELLVLNLAMDVNHTALGFVTSWVDALAEHAAHISVITMTAGEFDVAPNVAVHSIGKERGWSEPRRLVEFYRLLHQILDKRPIDACFAHMAPLFSALAAPVLRRRRIPVLLWYAHGAVSRQLRVAHALAERCVTPTEASFRLPSDKLYVVGHGIDAERFRPPDTPATHYGSTAITVGRLSAVKQIDVMIDAVAILRARGIDLRLELTGEPLTDADRRYERELRGQIRSLELDDAVHFAGSARFREVAERYHRGWLFLNLSETRSIDKAILESMASGCVPLSRNESFRRLADRHGLGSLVPAPGAEGLADAIAALRSTPAATRAQLTHTLREIVAVEHSLDALSEKIVGHLQELTLARHAAA